MKYVRNRLEFSIRRLRLVMTLQLIARAAVLFFFGALFSLVLNLLQVQRHLQTLKGRNLLFGSWSSPLWVPASCGLASGALVNQNIGGKCGNQEKNLRSKVGFEISCLALAAVGLIYPWVDRKLGEQKSCSQEWSTIMRCIALFVGINHASAKIDFSSHIELSLSLAVLSIAFWWWFDGTRSGFGLGITVAVIAVFVTYLLAYHGVCKYTERDFLHVRSWLPCVVFSGGVTVGNIGRQLAVNDAEEIGENKRHQE